MTDIVLDVVKKANFERSSGKENVWLCPLCGSKEYKQTLEYRRVDIDGVEDKWTKIYSCKKCTVLFLDPDRFCLKEPFCKDRRLL